MTTTKTIYSRLSELQKTLEVKKTRENKFAGFTYWNTDDILSAVKPLLEDGEFVTFDVSAEILLEHVYFVATVHFHAGKEIISATAKVREPAVPKAKMDESQTSGSAMTYAKKYALCNLLAIDDGYDPDGHNANNAPAKEQLKQPVNQPTPQQAEPEAAITKQEAIDLIKADQAVLEDNDTLCITRSSGAIVKIKGKNTTKENVQTKTKFISYAWLVAPSTWINVNINLNESINMELIKLRCK